MKVGDLVKVAKWASLKGQYRWDKIGIIIRILSLPTLRVVYKVDFGEHGRFWFEEEELMKVM